MAERVPDSATREAEIVNDSAMIEAITKAELDQAIATARAFPRSIKRFATECYGMATLNERVAASCLYALPRGGKKIEGPSVRLAEIVASAWGNSRSGARVIEEGERFLTAQGVFHDLERNVSITVEVRRRITDKDGRRYNDDMISTTANAACSIALRNAVFRGVPKAFWEDAYMAARKVAVGDAKSIVAKRAEALKACQQIGASEAMVLAALDVPGVQDIGQDELVVLLGLYNSVKSGEIELEDAFAPKNPPAEEPKPKRSKANAVKADLGLDAAKPKTEAPPEKAEEPAQDAPPPADDFEPANIVASLSSMMKEPKLKDPIKALVVSALGTRSRVQELDRGELNRLYSKCCDARDAIAQEGGAA